MAGTLLQSFKAVIEGITAYNNESFLVLLFLAALLFLWFAEEDRHLKTVLVYLPLALIAVFMFPVYAWVGMKIDAGVYYRVFWAIPAGVMVCYSAVKLMMRFKNPFFKIFVFALTIAVICLNGRLVYKSTIHFKATNVHHIPQNVIDVAEALKLENYRPIAVMPIELMPFLRQYTADIFTPYGRNMMEASWSFSNELYDAMESDKNTYDAVRVAECARNEHCTYVVLSSMKNIQGSMEEQNYFLLNFVQGYYIYMDYNYYDVLKEQGLLDDDVIEVGEKIRNEK